MQLRLSILVGELRQNVRHEDKLRERLSVRSGVPLSLVRLRLSRDGRLTFSTLIGWIVVPEMSLFLISSLSELSGQNTLTSLAGPIALGWATIPVCCLGPAGSHRSHASTSLRDIFA
jgi:hypothetical protein